jgi:hypothetical protein
MKLFCCLVVGVSLAALTVCRLDIPSPAPAAPPAQKETTVVRPTPI